MTYTTKSLIAASLLVFTAAPSFAAGLSAKDVQAQAWEKVEEANTVTGEAGSTGLVFQAEVDQYARELAAGKIAPDAGHASARPVSPKAPLVIDATQSQTGG
jgi:orotidine-5'-phosphate decarboxylase